MALSVNKVILIGNLGADPKIHKLDNDVKLANFSLAMTENYKDKDGNWQEKTEWVNILAWRWLADFAEKNLKKGSKIYLEGKLQTRTYEQDGVTKYTTEVVASQFVSMVQGEKRNNAPLPNEADAPHQGANQNTSSEGNFEGEILDDDQPF